MLKLKNSGYTQKFRTEILDSGMKAYQKMLEEDKNGTKPLYRSRNWNEEERQASKTKKKFNWWNTEKSKIQYKTVLFVTPTPGGVLAKALRKREEELNRNNPERIKIEEKGGLKIKDFLPKNPAPFVQKARLWLHIQEKSKSHATPIILDIGGLA